jgi:hypothetical protein
VWSLRPSVRTALELGQVLRAVGTLGDESVVQLPEASALRVAELKVIHRLLVGVRCDSGLHCTHCTQSLRRAKLFDQCHKHYADGRSKPGSGKGSVLFESMAEQPTQRSRDLDGERVRRLRLRADGRRPLAVNLKETIALTRKLFELRDAARRSR